MCFAAAVRETIPMFPAEKKRAPVTRRIQEDAPGPTTRYRDRWLRQPARRLRRHGARYRAGRRVFGATSRAQSARRRRCGLAVVQPNARGRPVLAARRDRPRQRRAASRRVHLHAAGGVRDASRPDRRRRHDVLHDGTRSYSIDAATCAEKWQRRAAELAPVAARRAARLRLSRRRLFRGTSTRTCSRSTLPMAARSGIARWTWRRRRASRCRWRRSPQTAWSSSATRAATRPASPGTSTRSTRKTAASCGVSTWCPKTPRCERLGRTRTAIRSRAARSGRRSRSTPSAACSTYRRATPRPTSTWKPAAATTCTRTR